MYRDARGYFAFPLIEEDLVLDDFDKWSIVGDLVGALKAGDLRAAPTVLELYDRDADWVRRGAYVKMIGDAAPDALVERIHSHLQTGLPVDYSWDFAELLFHWGRLDIVPTLARGWRAAYQYQDGPDIPPRLALLLEEESWGPLRTDFPRKVDEKQADAYVARVLARHAELVESLGEHAFVFRGRLLDLEWIARRGLQDLADGEFDSRMRRKFEAMTGIDCSCFYHKEKLQPLAAAAVFEAFLASPERKAFTPGRRYFFGHPIPPGDPAGASEWPPR
ncbi:hypothetical protein ENSA5_70130 [Enhygromyxa salina]|uniref:Uncharacterized protein n=1 Tax=Enhygromyxa salina TaxID=215803 RepID=A0A2S9XAM0_9BACT|nr:hypothetical protein [Enhygromyxa salina]PRP89906.1 hypothetical protein ENSA5_70130 [Enhygromyxa salina]